MTKVTAWDDGSHKTIRKVTIAYGNIAVDSFRVKYEDDGISFWGNKHGGDGGERVHQIKLNYPKEYLISITGYHTTVNSENVIKSLKFHTNSRTYGPFGYQTGKFFVITPPDDCKIVGFSGSNGEFLSSLEVHTRNINREVKQGRFYAAGPYGGKGEIEWNDGDMHTGVRQIKLAYDSLIHSVCIEYDDDGRSIWSDTHGGNGGSHTTTIELDYPKEYLISVSGNYSATSDDIVFIRSLTFQSNKKFYGPFGVEKGVHFSLASENHKIIGFHGTSSDYLDSLGVYMQSVPAEFESLGPFGGSGGSSWDDKHHSRVKQIVIVYGTVIDSISFQYDDGEVKHGGDGGSHREVVTFDGPDEFLISASGYYAKWGRLEVICSLAFESNMRRFGPFGDRIGRYFSLPSFGGKIVGFFGKAGFYLDALGAHVQPMQPSFKPHYIGSFGGRGGHSWDDGIYSTVRKIEIQYNSVIHNIRVEYDDNGRSVCGEQHGGESKGKKTPTIEIEIDYPNEYVVSISGHILTDHIAVVQSLTIQTNRKQYGPIGREKGKEFSLETFGSKIVGFHGRSGIYLDAIGVYTVPLPMASIYERTEAHGGTDGSLWDDGVHHAIRRIKVSTRDRVDSISFEYDKNGRSVWSTEHGGDADGKRDTIKLDYPGEYLLSISGFHDQDNHQHMRSLAFGTNKKKYGPFGPQRGEPFSIQRHGHKIVGFHGNVSDKNLVSIGVYLVPISVRSNPSHFLEAYGGEGGDAWDDGIHDNVRKIAIGTSGHGIQYICFEYDKNGRHIRGEEHGDNPTGEILEIELDYTNEFLISLSGYYSEVKGSSAAFIRSLTFQTNKRIFGPYGKRVGTRFSTVEHTGKIVGFHGRSGGCLYKIGIYTKPIMD